MAGELENLSIEKTLSWLLEGKSAEDKEGVEGIPRSRNSMCEGTEAWSIVMVHFMCPLDWATGCPDIWPNIILDVSVRVFLDEVNI